MEFIPLPDNAIAHQVIPDLGGPEFDHQGFHGYDQRQGWNVGALRKGNIRAACTNWLPYAESIYRSDRPPGPPVSISKVVGTVASAFVQTWILFGILQEALRRPVFRHEVSRKVTSVDSEGRTVSTHHINVRRVFAEFLKKEKNWRRTLSGLIDSTTVCARPLKFCGISKFCTIGSPAPSPLSTSILRYRLLSERWISTGSASAASSWTPPT